VDAIYEQSKRLNKQDADAAAHAGSEGAASGSASGGAATLRQEAERRKAKFRAM
jgi:hypothetical protein